MTYLMQRRMIVWIGCLMLAVGSTGCAKGASPELGGGTILDEEDAGSSGDDVGDVGTGTTDAVGDDADAVTGGDVFDADADGDEGCDGDEDCPGDEICVRAAPDSDGQCQVVDDGGVEGDACAESADCETGLCVDGVCSRACEDFHDCLDGWTCSPEGVCEAPGCAHDGNCAEGQWCAVATHEDAGTLETICLPDNGGVEGGEACEEHSDCLGRYCLEGMCTTPCEDPDQCGGIDMCEPKAVEKDGLEGVFDLCQPPGLIECTAPGDCGPADLTCNMPIYDEDDAIDGASCGPTNPGQGELGENCAGNAQCESSFCLPVGDGTSGTCSVFCEDSSSHCGTAQACLEVDDDLGVCANTCERNADCDGDGVCRFGLDTSDELIKSCRQAAGDAELGEECEVDTNCESGLCLNIYYPDAFCGTDDNCPGDLKCGPCPPGAPCSGQQVCQISSCSAVCATNVDCAGDHEMTECADDIVMTLEGGQQVVVSACAPP